MEAIQCSHAGLQDAMVNIKTDNGPTDMQNNFEVTEIHPSRRDERFKAPC